MNLIDDAKARWGVWLPGDQVMVCPGCGLDAT